MLPSNQHTEIPQTEERVPSHHRAALRRAMTLRVDYTTAQGRVWLGLVRNLSLQGMYIACEEQRNGYGTLSTTGPMILTPRCREGDCAMRDSMLVDHAAAPEASRSQRWAGGVIALLLLITCWGAWVFLIGFRPCVLSYVFWR